MLLNFRCDYPTKTSSNIKLAATTLVTDLYREAIKQTGIDSSATGYCMRCLTYGSDSILLSLNDTRTIAMVGVRTNSIIYLSAPLSSRAPSTLPKVKGTKKQRDGEPELDRSKPSDRYKGITDKTILKKLMAGLNPAHHVIALEYIELNTRTIFASPGWLLLPRKYVKQIIALDQLNATEVYHIITTRIRVDDELNCIVGDIQCNNRMVYERTKDGSSTNNS